MNLDLKEMVLHSELKTKYKRESNIFIEFLTGLFQIYRQLKVCMALMQSKVVGGKTVVCI